MKRTRLSALVTLFTVAACGGAQNEPPATPRPVATVDAKPPAVASTPDAEFRKKAPMPGPEPTFRVPQIQEARLKNGVRVLWVTRRDLPIVAFSIASDHGADQGSPGLASFAESMLWGGTKTKDALALSDAWEALGARHSSWSDYDSLGLSVQVLTSKVDAALGLAVDMLQNSVFPADELERVRSRRLNALAQEKDNPGATLSRHVAGVVFGSQHPYGTPAIGTETSVKGARREDLMRFLREHVVPSRVTVAFAGDINGDDAVALAEKHLGSWKGQAKKPNAPQPPKAAKGARVILINRPGATQSHVSLCDVGVPRKNPDYDALLVMNTILGGQFSSRINLNLREKHAYTYGAGSSFDMRRGAGPFATHGAIVREKTEPAISELLAEMRRIQKEPVTSEELEAAKNYLVKALPGRFETAQAAANSATALSMMDLPLDEFATRPMRLAKVTAEDVQRVAAKYLDLERMRLVVLGDAEVVKAGLEKLNWGPVEMR